MLTTLRTSSIWNEAASDVDGQDALYHNANNSYPQPGSLCDVDGHVPQVDSYTSYFAQNAPHNGYVSLGDIELKNTLNVPVTAIQPPQSLLDGQYGGDVQDENNLTNLWYSYGVSTGYDTAEEYIHTDVPALAYYMQGLEFTHAGTTEQPDAHLQTLTSPNDPCQMPPSLSACQHRVQIVRRWLSDHASGPYPTPAEKAALTESAGCSEHQLNVCFRNLRAREKHCKLVHHIPIPPSNSASSI